MRPPLGDDPRSGSASPTLSFAGVTTEVCVQTTMREANDRGYECLLIEDATESYFPEFKAATLEMITAQGAIVGWTAPLAALESGGRREGGGMTAPFDAEAHVDHMAQVLDLADRPGVAADGRRRRSRRRRAIAALVTEFPARRPHRAGAGLRAVSGDILLRPAHEIAAAVNARGASARDVAEAAPRPHRRAPIRASAPSPT